MKLGHKVHTEMNHSGWSTCITLHKLRLPNCFETSPSHPPAQSEIANSIFICWVKLSPHYPHPHPSHINCPVISRIQQRSEMALHRKCLGVFYSGSEDYTSTRRQPRSRVMLLYKLHFKSFSAQPAVLVFEESFEKELRSLLIQSPHNICIS